MIKNRKDEHIAFAFKQGIRINRFDDVFLESTDLPEMSIEDIDLSTTFLGYDIPYPFYINAMTGGSLKATEINEFLSKLANHFNLPMVLGSQSIAIKDASWESSFKVARKHHNGLLISNVNPNFTLEQAKKAIQMVDSNGLSIHINLIQELSMAEGDRDFRLWNDNIKNIVSNIQVPVYVKQVGQGMSLQTVQKLKKLGVKAIDVSGKGGTSFIEIESNRSKTDYSYLESFGIETVDALLNLKDETELDIYASGGIRNPLDVIKALTLGAKAVGLSKWFLLLTELSMEEAIQRVEQFITDLKKIMLIVGKQNIKALKEVKYKVKS